MAKVLTSKDFDKRLKKLANSRITKKVEEVKYLMKRDTIEGNFISKRLFPKEYVVKYRINNLWRYPIESYRLIYTIVSEQNERVKEFAILDILTHKEYSILFGYDTH